MANISESLVEELTVVLGEYDMTLPTGPEAAAKATIKTLTKWLESRNPFDWQESAEQAGFDEAIGMLEREVLGNAQTLHHPPKPDTIGG
jgi:hypothetical protein